MHSNNPELFICKPKKTNHWYFNVILNILVCNFLVCQCARTVLALTTDACQACSVGVSVPFGAVDPAL